MTATAVDRVGLHRRAVLLVSLTIGWNVIEGFIAVGAGLAAGSVALVSFGADSGVEVLSAVGLLWRLAAAGPDATDLEESDAERKALWVVGGTFFLLAAYITFESIATLVSDDGPDSSTIGLVLSVLSLAIMPMLAFAKHRTGTRMDSRALQADAMETWVCSYLSLALLAGVGLHAAFGWSWADPVAALAMLPVIIREGWETLGEARNDDHDHGGERAKGSPAAA